MLPHLNVVIRQVTSPYKVFLIHLTLSSSKEHNLTCFDSGSTATVDTRASGLESCSPPKGSCFFLVFFWPGKLGMSKFQH